MLLGLYRHYKGGMYLVRSIARHTENGDKLVIYQSMYGDYGMWARPQSMFEGKVEYEGKTVDRFTYMGNPGENAPEMTH